MNYSTNLFQTRESDRKLLHVSIHPSPQLGLNHASLMSVTDDNHNAVIFPVDRAPLPSTSKESETRLDRIIKSTGDTTIQSDIRMLHTNFMK